MNTTIDYALAWWGNLSFSEKNNFSKKYFDKVFSSNMSIYQMLCVYEKEVLEFSNDSESPAQNTFTVEDVRKRAIKFGAFIRNYENTAWYSVDKIYDQWLKENYPDK